MFKKCYSNIVNLITLVFAVWLPSPGWTQYDNCDSNATYQVLVEHNVTIVLAMQAYQVLVEHNMIIVVAMQAYQVLVEHNMTIVVAMQAYQVLVEHNMAMWAYQV